MSTGPDWTIRIPGSETPLLTQEQRDLLQRLEAELPTSREDARDVSVLQAASAPIVHALIRSGLTGEEVADHSRLRPAFVASMADAGA